MKYNVISDDFYEKIKPHLHRRIGRELRLAGRVLDLGCGACDLVRYLARTYHQRVIGVDISNGSFPSRRHTSNGKQFRCIRKNAKRLPFVRDTSMDAVVSMWALHEMAEPQAIIRESKRVLRPGGELFIIDFPRGSLAQRLWNEKYFQPKQVRVLIQEAGFERVQVRLIEQKQVMWARGYRPPLVRNGTTEPHGQEHMKAKVQE